MEQHMTDDEQYVADSIDKWIRAGFYAQDRSEERRVGKECPV